jgi:hypothetical protein
MNLQLFVVSRSQYWEMSDVLANIAVAILIFTLRMATAMFAETFDKSQYSALLRPESRSFTLNSCRQNL